VAITQAQRTLEQAAKLSEQGNWTAAAHEWQLAADRARLLNDRTNLATALHNLGQAERQLGHTNQAHQLYTEAAGLNQKLGRQADWWRNQIALLQLEARARDAHALQTRFQHLLSLAPGSQRPEVAALFYNELGLWQQSQGELRAAAESFQQALARFTASNDQAGAAVVLANQARLQEAQRNFGAAVADWQVALSRFEGLGDPPGIAQCLLGLGRALLEARQDLPRAEDLLRRAATNFALLKAPADRQAALRLLTECLQAEEKKSEAEAVQKELDKLAR
jgi:tetratricopeptide (TPR) repeat protein